MSGRRCASGPPKRLASTSQLEQVVKDLVEPHGQMPASGHEVSPGGGDVPGQPLTMGAWDHPVLIALPDGDRRCITRRDRRESPVLHERKVIVAPSGDAAAKAGPERAGYVFRQLTMQGVLVRLR